MSSASASKRFYSGLFLVKDGDGCYYAGFKIQHVLAGAYRRLLKYRAILDRLYILYPSFVFCLRARD